MFFTRKRIHYVWPALGLLVGAIIGGMCPHTPMHATATDRYDTFAVCTGYLDNDIEAIYFLDFLTGDLKASAIAKQPPYGFNAYFERNVFQDLQVDPSMNPRFLMVSGVANLRRAGGRQQISSSLVYITEVTTGRCVAYAVPWDPSRYAAGMKIRGELVLVGTVEFRTAIVREQ